MNADIMLLSNTLVYGHRLRCASPAVAEARLALSTDFVGSQGSAWLRSAVDPLRRVVFLDTGEATPPHTGPPGPSVTNLK
jgi:superfamily I DNA and/or RNA helicase